MPGYKITRRQRLCDGRQPEYVAGHNKLALIYGVWGSDTPGNVRQSNPKARITRKDNTNA